MSRNTRYGAAAVICGLAAVAAAAGTVAAAGAAGAVPGAAADRAGTWAAVSAVTKAAGGTAPNTLSPGLSEHAVAQGSRALDGGTSNIPFYGYLGNGPLLPAPGALPVAGGPVVEAQKTEPDKNTYLVLPPGQKGADPAYDYGTHFLYAGHEGGVGYVTRVNLDADDAHRVTLLASTDTAGAALPTIDGSTWDPFAQKLLLTTEGGAVGVYQSSLSYPATAESLGAELGTAGYEGVQNDSDGNVWLVEDIGGTTIAGTKVKLPNSFVYRFAPVDPRDLTKGGRLEALQVLSTTGQPITYAPIDADHPTGNALSQDQLSLHDYGSSFATRWVTVHDTATDTSGAVFNATDLAKAAGATPFKRPENGQFRPGTHFGQFIFDETGDTNADSTANDAYGGWGSLFSLTQSGPSATTGTLSLLYKGDKAHTGFDNLTFLDADHLAVVEDAGDTLHTQRAAFDSAYVLDVSADYATAAAPVRFLGEGRDPSATIDSALGAYPGFANDGDNEITGIHASNGDPAATGLLGATVPEIFHNGWRLFWTQQHGDNTTWEITPAS